jgi:uncharacterized phage protein (TIGR02218 family)
MSVFDDIDKSVHGSAPIECYKFIGELKTYRYTSNNEEVTVNGEVYEPLSGIRRNSIETSSILDNTQSIDVTMPITCEVATTYNFLKMPMTLELEIRAVHRGTNFATDWKLIWQGQSTGFPVQNNDATIQTKSIIQSALGQQLNQILYQTSCNHEVYDDFCTLDPAPFTTTTTVTKIKDNVITVVSTGRTDGELIIGKMVNTRTTESRSIVSNIGHIVTVGYPFIDIKLGDTIDLIVGCDNRYSTCLNVFNNVINFLGFMWTPTDNPYVNPV